ncbi:MAG: protein TolR [Nitrincola lacisaponensis]|uniref:Tol-Pal system protein TolR n=1 Tax=Nitrincola lacisaponensis TaxID=267850 RepID=A0A063Y0V0_9GAMM|nr:protein TolR [Nitrincola lacisaponensis]KDE38391.1 Tol biopolymer transport system, TolR protein [Nitrincola lacisaponensis]
MEWRTRKKRNLNAEINVVPYIEVMVVLLVIFMLTTPMLTQGVDVDLPQATADPVETDDQEPLIVTVDRDGNYYINVGGSDSEAVDGEVVSQRISSVLSENPNKLLLVRGDKNVTYDRVVQLMVLLQQAGAPSVGLVTE